MTNINLYQCGSGMVIEGSPCKRVVTSSKPLRLWLYRTQLICSGSNLVCQGLCFEVKALREGYNAVCFCCFF